MAKSSIERLKRAKDFPEKFRQLFEKQTSKQQQEIAEIIRKSSPPAVRTNNTLFLAKNGKQPGSVSYSI